MPTVVPGVSIKERDFSLYAPALGITSLALVGGATRGALNTPTVITNEGDLVRTFGRPITNDYGLHAAIQFLKRGNNLLFTRVASSSVETADINLVGTSGGTAAVKAVGTVAFVAATNPTDGDTVTLRKTVPYMTLENDANGAIGNTAIVLGGTGVGTRIKKDDFQGGTPTTRATGWIKFIGSALPLDEDTITVNDGTHTPVIFEFDDDSNVSGGNVAVTIVAGDPYATLANLVAAIQAAASLNVSATNATVSRTFEFDDNATYGGSNTPVAIGLTAGATLLNLKAAIDAYAPLGLTTEDATVTVPTLQVTSGTGGIDGNSLIETDGSAISVSGFTGGVDATPGANQTVATAYANTPGSWGNGVEIRIVCPSTEIGANASAFDLEVWAPVDNSGALAAVERRTNLSLSASDDRFVETAINSGIDGEFGPSEYITVDALVASGTVTSGTYTLATSGGPNVDGLDLAASDYIGAFGSQSATGLKALRNPEVVDFNLVAVPGVTHRDVIAEVIDLCETRGDCFALIDPPFGLSAQQVVAWHNGTSGIAHAPIAALNSSYAAIFWSWVKEYDPYTKKTLWLPPSGFAAQAFAFNDANGGPWKIPAGPNRGLISGQDLEVKPDIDTRRLLQVTGSNRVNPIISKPDTGLQLYGNRTTQRRASALENIHTRRMLIYAEKLIATATQYLVFEPNTSATWRAFESLVRPILAQIKANEGLERFDVLANESTNPPAQRQQQKLMRGRIRIAAVEGAEAIEVEFNLFATGATFADA